LTILPPLPDQPGAYLLVDDDWILDHRTELPALPDLNHGTDSQAAVDGGPGGLLLDFSDPDGH
jgi:hypothetical protein